MLEIPFFPKNIDEQKLRTKLKTDEIQIVSGTLFARSSLQSKITHFKAGLQANIYDESAILPRKFALCDENIRNLAFVNIQICCFKDEQKLQFLNQLPAFISKDQINIQEENAVLISKVKTADLRKLISFFPIYFSSFGKQLLEIRCQNLTYAALLLGLQTPIATILAGSTPRSYLDSLTDSEAQFLRINGVEIAEKAVDIGDFELSLELVKGPIDAQIQVIQALIPEVAHFTVEMKIKELSSLQTIVQQFQIAPVVVTCSQEQCQSMNLQNLQVQLQFAPPGFQYDYLDVRFLTTAAQSYLIAQIGANNMKIQPYFANPQLSTIYNQSFQASIGQFIESCKNQVSGKVQMQPMHQYFMIAVQQFKSYFLQFQTQLQMQFLQQQYQMQIMAQNQLIQNQGSAPQSPVNVQHVKSREKIVEQKYQQIIVAAQDQIPSQDSAPPSPAKAQGSEQEQIQQRKVVTQNSGTVGNKIKQIHCEGKQHHKSTVVSNDQLKSSRAGVEQTQNSVNKPIKQYYNTMRPKELAQTCCNKMDAFKAKFPDQCLFFFNTRFDDAKCAYLLEEKSILKLVKQPNSFYFTALCPHCQQIIRTVGESLRAYMHIVK